MKKIRFLMMLALLVVGVSSVNARTYTIRYSGVPDGKTGDYQVMSLWRSTPYSTTYYGYEIGNNYVKNSSTQLTVTSYYYTGTNFSTYRDDDDILGNPHYYIQPRQFEGYDANVSASKTGNTYYINIAYTTSTEVKWNDGIFEYSTRHTQASGDIQNLSDNQVSISLWLGETEEITDTIVSFGPLWDHTAVGQTNTELPDWGNPDIDSEENITYEYLGQLTNATPHTGSYFYLRTHTVPVSKVKNVVIPREVTHDNQNYEVTAIQKWGFCYLASDCNPRYYCAGSYSTWKGGNEEDLIESGKAVYDYGNINDHRNDYLVSVSFESPSNVTQIGDYAFMSNKALKSIIVPSSVENLGQGVWECCTALTDIRFQTTDITDDNGNTYDGVKFKTIKNFTFWFCTALQTLILPDGITAIEGTAIGAPLQYMFSLIDLKLPNTLKTIGPHFVCCCTQLETLAIPASVTSIDGACFHGCESLKSVYLLGDASALQAQAGSGENTFGENKVFCADAVSNCKFYTTADYVADYAGDEVWAKIADNRETETTGWIFQTTTDYLTDEDGRIKDNNGNDVVVSGSGNGNNNELLVIRPVTQKFAYKWVTACFPDGLPLSTDTKHKTYKDAELFGPDAMVARMVGATAVNGSPVVYHLKFQLIPDAKIPAGEPFLICPSLASIDNNIQIIEHWWQNQYKAEMTKNHISEVEADNGAIVQMISRYYPSKLNVGDFYFASTENVGENETVGNFYKVTEQKSAPTIGAFKCFWQINIDNVRDLSNARLSVKGIQRDDVVSEGDGTVDGINNVENVKIVVDIYDANGRKLDIPQESLPQGFYIVNGKKVIIK